MSGDNEPSVRARRGQPSRDRIERMLSQLLEGELTPREATWRRWEEDGAADRGGANEPHGPAAARRRERGNAAAAEAATGESLASLIERLGPPPTDIVDAWCDQWEEIAAAHEAASSQPLPPIDLHHWSLSPTGDLVWRGQASRPAARAARYRLAMAATSRGRIEAVKQRLRFDTSVAEGETPGAGETPGDEFIASGEGSFGDELAAAEGSDSTPRHRRRKRSSMRRRRRNTAAVVTAGALVVTAAALVVMGGMLWPRSAPAPRGASITDGTLASPATQTGSPPRQSAASEPSKSANTPEPDAAPRGPERFPRPSRTGAAEAEAPPAPVGAGNSPGEAGNSSGEADSLLTLDSLMPGSADFVSSAAQAASGERSAGDEAKRSRAPASSGGRPVPRSSHDRSVAGNREGGTVAGEAAVPPEVVQPTRAGKDAAVELPAVDDPSATAILFSAPVAKPLKLDFPLQTSLQLRADASGAGWRVERLSAAADEPEVLARLRRGERAVSLRWTAAAAEQPSMAHRLCHGRLTTGTGQHLYLRPTVTAAPVAVRLDQSDVRPTWDLQRAIPAGAARIAIELELPEGIQMTWMERPEETSPRRTRGIAVLSAEDAETVALAIRLDVRCRRHLSLRLRYAARLDRSMPWQIVSADGLNRLRDQLDDRLAGLDIRKSRAAALYRLAGSTEKRVLKARRDRIERAVQSHRQLAERLAELQSLAASVKSGASIHVELSVAWPGDATQTIFTTHQERTASDLQPPER